MKDALGVEVVQNDKVIIFNGTFARGEVLAVSETSATVRLENGDEWIYPRENVMKENKPDYVFFLHKKGYRGKISISSFDSVSLPEMAEKLAKGHIGSEVRYCSVGDKLKLLKRMTVDEYKECGFVSIHKRNLGYFSPKVQRHIEK